MSCQVIHSTTPAHAYPAAIDDPLVGSYAAAQNEPALDIYFARGGGSENEDLIFVRRGNHLNHEVCHYGVKDLLQGLETCSDREAAIYRDVAQRIKHM